jgi:oligoendopeptidase F
LFGKYVHYRDVLGQIYRSVVDDWREENVGIRKYREPIQVRNIANDIPDQAVDTLLEVCEKHHHLFHRFFEVKKKRLNLATFSRFDLYAPVKPGDEEIDYDQGMRMVLESFREFAPEFEQFTRQLIDANHIHSRCQKNKRGGAFCSYTGARVMPYVLLNYAGKTRDVSTLAHELGHAIHGMLAREQTEMTYIASLPMAETASIFAEMLLSEKLMARYPERAAEMSFQKLEDIYASVVRQAGFVAFEKKAHRMLEGGGTVEEISQVYIDDLRRQLGDKLPVDEVFRHEWSYIPHIFHTPFYCYAYAFGNLLTLGLYQLYKENGASFGPKIISMLARGGSDSPQNLAQSLGIDLCSAAFWEKCFKQVEVMVDRVQELA